MSVPTSSGPKHWFWSRIDGLVRSAVRGELEQARAVEQAQAEGRVAGLEHRLTEALAQQAELAQALASTQAVAGQESARLGDVRFDALTRAHADLSARMSLQAYEAAELVRALEMKLDARIDGLTSQLGASVAEAGEERRRLQETLLGAVDVAPRAQAERLLVLENRAGEIANAVAETRLQLEAVQPLGERMLALENHIGVENQRSAEGRLRLETLVVETASAIAGQQGQRLLAIDNRTGEIANALGEIALRLETSIVETANGIADLHGPRLLAIDNRTGEIANALGEIALRLETSIVETANGIAHLQGQRLLAIDNRTGEIANALGEIALRLETSIVETANGIADLHGPRLLAIDNRTGEIANALGEIALRLETSIVETANGIAHLQGQRLLAIDNRTGEIADALGEAQLRLEKVIVETSNVIAQRQGRQLLTLDNRTAEIFNAVSESHASLQNVISEASNTMGHQHSTTLSSIETRTGELAQIAANQSYGEQILQLSNAMHAILNGVQENRLRIENYGWELKNAVTHLTTSTETKLLNLDGRVLDQVNEAVLGNLRARASACSSRPPLAESTAYRLARPLSFHAYLEQARSDFPIVYDAWKERLDTMEANFASTKVGNAANDTDSYSHGFRDFVRLFAGGHLLDIGTGVFGRPFYLTDYPAQLISGLEPLLMQTSPDFELVRGLGEYLPWPDGSFSTVTSATSLDHCLSLDRSLDEMVRVLMPGGRLLLWIGAIPGAPTFDPDSADYKPADVNHLFHFDTSWFDLILEQRFSFVERVEMRRQAYSHVFYALDRRSA